LNEVAVRERRAFRDPSGAAGVLQEDQVLAVDRRRRKAEIGALAQRVIERNGVCQPGIHVTGTGRDHVLYGGLADDFSERRRYAAEDDDDLGARIVQLVLELARGIERVHVHLDRTGAQDADHRDREGRDVGQHHGDALAFLHPQPALQVGGEVARKAVGIGVGQRAAEAAERRPGGVALHRLLEQLHHRGMRIGVDRLSLSHCFLRLDVRLRLNARLRRRSQAGDTGRAILFGQR
jgi:hypothetical protein